ncbi:SDR family oxidoreductase [Nigerium massiliense]|uniref:SDR family oxidoreductase n=1 Tax=Nigerium massiliense TaxID=1522317 RepID=UPI00058FF594|nr:SDR family oxidoreductase [Nigerium massiliense]
MDLGLTGKVFLVTAASSGLGKATAQQLAAEGAKVFLVARGEEKLAALTADLGEDAAAYLAADLGEPGTAEKVAAAAVERFGRLDGALVSVGGPPKGRVLDVADDTWTEAFNSVFLAAVRTARAVVAAAAGPVSLAFVLSSSVKSPLPEMALSNGMRPGLAMVLKQLAGELGPQGSRVVGLMPGTIQTARIDFLTGQADDPAQALKDMGAGAALKRVGQPEEFGRVAAFLLSDAASYVTGSMIPVDGGSIPAL